MDPSLACLNGQFLAPEVATIPIWDRGFLFGDAVYEVFRIYGGRCFLEREHRERLIHSLAQIKLDGVDIDRLMDRVHETIRRTNLQDGTAYVHLTRGSAPRSHAFPEPAVEPTELIVVRPYNDAAMTTLRQSGASIYSQPDLRWGRCDIKSTNLLANVLALEEAKRRGGLEAVLVDHEGLVTESTHTSLLWVRNGILQGTPDGPEILPGTTRNLTIALAQDLGLSFEPVRVTLDQLIAADEVVLAGTTTEIMGVVRIDEQSIGTGQPGPITRQLQQAFCDHIAEWLTQDDSTVSGVTDAEWAAVSGKSLSQEA